jgi:maltose O-acetyltransferase
MLSGEFYNASDSQLADERKQARVLLHRLNTSEYGDDRKYPEIISRLLPHCESDIWIESPFYCDYGYNIYAGPKVFFNFDCLVLDVCSVRIGSNVMFGPGVHIYTATHPKDILQRREGREYGKPITIGDDCWIGGRPLFFRASILVPGVSSEPEW